MLKNLSRRKIIALFGGGAALTLLAVVLRPLLHLGKTLSREKKLTPVLPETEPTFINDARRLNRTEVKQVWKIPSDKEEAETQLRELFQVATKENHKISFAGQRHSMGGHVIYPNGIVVDALPFNHLELDESKSLLTAGAGARWQEILPYLDARGYSVTIMQSNHDFSVGGSLSVNCHGWQTGMSPISSSVDSLRIMLADGSILRCSRSENSELFSLALGGYGLFGFILDATLKVVKNQNYVFRSFQQNTKQYLSAFEKNVGGNPDVQMAYGRLCVDTRDFLQDSLLNVLTVDRSKILHLSDEPSTSSENVARLILRGSVGSEYGKRLRWDAETGKYLDLQPKGPISRNRILHEPVALYQEKAAGVTDILHEYFVPRGKLEDFLVPLRKIIPTFKGDLLNVTIRDVNTDRDSFLNYAREDVFGLVMLFNYPATTQADRAMEEMTKVMIDAVLSMGGTYYLPYRLHASEGQFSRAYPRAREFFTFKRKYDPNALFQNRFYQKYYLRF